MWCTRAVYVFFKQLPILDQYLCLMTWVRSIDTWKVDNLIHIKNVIFHHLMTWRSACIYILLHEHGFSTVTPINDSYVYRQLTWACKFELSVFCKVFKLRKFYQQYDNLDEKCFVADIDSCSLRGWLPWLSAFFVTSGRIRIVAKIAWYRPVLLAVSIYPMCHHGCHWMNFGEIWYWGLLWNSV
jgi:hypothetical protein